VSIAEGGDASLLALLADPLRHAEGLLKMALAAIAAGDTAEALRYADRARRLNPRGPVVTQLCARLLSAAGQPPRGLELLDRADPTGHWTALGLLRAELSLAANEPDRAAAALSELCALFAIEALPGLAALAAETCARSRGRHVGWAALSADGCLVGALDGAHLGLLEGIDHGAGAPDSHGLTPFKIQAPPAPEAIAHALGRAAPLIGASRLRWPPAWRFDGVVEREGDRIQGSATLGWAPGHALPVSLRDESGGEIELVTQARAGADGSITQVFAVERDQGLGDGAIIATALLPDGRRIRLQGGGEPRAAPVRPRPRRRPIRPGPAARRGISVIVPVHAGLDETLNCLRSVIETIESSWVTLVVVYDQGPEPALLAALQGLAEKRQITLLVNDRNLGFPASVNRGMALRRNDDVVLLNADAEVHGDWLDRLAAAAYARNDIATATPFSNVGSIMSYPGGDEIDCDRALSSRLDQLFSRNPDTALVELPTAVGFCMYIRRACLAKVGYFEEEAFGPGYGEENDFCLRASAAGWRHVAAVNVFVRHAGGRSFGPLKAVLVENNLRVLERRHPGYGARVRRFLDEDPLHGHRRWADSHWIAMDRRPAVLMITLGREGGVGRHLADRRQAMQAEGARVIELKPAADDQAPGLCRIIVAGEAFDDLTYSLPTELDALSSLLGALPITRVEIHHFLDLDPSVLDLPRRLGLPFEIVVHDYSWICPRITLIGGDGRYCGEPDIAACERCVARHGSLIDEVISVGDLRARGRRLFAAARTVTVSCADVATRLGRHFPEVKFRITPWEAPIAPACPPGRGAPGPGRPPRRARVAIIGAIGEHKGFAHLLACARDAAARDLALEFVVIGYTEDDVTLFETGRVFVTGRFEDDEVAGLIERERCDVVFFPSVAPETWSYALTHGLRCGLPIVALDFGAVGERLRGRDRARLLAPDSNAVALNDALIAAARPGIAVAVRARGQGELTFEADAWARAGGEHGWIEGVRIELAGAQYRAILAGGAQTPWMDAPAWCGDPAGSRPLMGLALRLGGDLALARRLECAAVFASGLTAVAAADGAFCRSPMQNDPLVALRIAVSRP